MSEWWILAQAATSQPAARGGDAFWMQIVPIILMIGVFYFIMMRGQRRERKRQADMLNSVKRGDKIQTIGGLYGTVVDVRDTEIVLKVDENSNVKVRLNRGAIKEVIRDAPAAGGEKKE